MGEVRKWKVATYYVGPRPIRRHVSAYVRDWSPSWDGFAMVEVWARSGSEAKRLAVTERIRSERTSDTREHWEAEARRACAQPAPGYTPAVRRVAAWTAESEAAWTEGGDGAIGLSTPREAYGLAVDIRIDACLRARGWYADGIEWIEEWWDDRHHAEKVRDRWAAILQAQDRKHGGGS